LRTKLKEEDLLNLFKLIAPVDMLLLTVIAVTAAPHSERRCELGGVG